MGQVKLDRATERGQRQVESRWGEIRKRRAGEAILVGAEQVG